MIVCKFGGTSVASFKGAEKIKQIIESNYNRKIVVVSALGKSEKYSVKITDLLYKLYVNILEEREIDGIIEEIFFRYEELSKLLNVKVDWNAKKRELIKHITKGDISKDFIASRGEYYSSILYSKYLNMKFVDASTCIIFKKNKTIDYAKTKKMLNEIMSNNTNFVIGGFYGADSKGNVVTFDRGGSDITGALIAKLLNAEIYENYTDVNGVYDRNPNVFKNASQLPLLNFKTAIQMADAGNEIVHKSALSELKDSNTVLIVKSTYENKNLGTVVVDNNLVLNQTFMCMNNCIVLAVDNLDDKVKKYIYSTAQVQKIIKHNGVYIIIIKSLYDNINNYKNINGFVFIKECYVLTIFSNLKINKKNVNKLKEMLKKFKKYSIFNNFITYLNNYLIIFDKNNLEKIKQILDL